MTVITHRPAVDWLTLTTYDLKKSQAVERWVTDRRLEPLRDGWSGKMYYGSFGDGWFIGQGEQAGGMHHMIRFSGTLADRFMFDRARPGGLDCPRMDIQLTLPTPYSGKTLYRMGQKLVDELDQAEQERGQRARKVTPLMAPNGEFTIYLGTRAGSERFTRFYVKPYENDTWLLRFETEFKAKSGLAGKVYRAVGMAPESMVRILAGELTSWPPHPLILPFKRHLEGVAGDIMRQERTRPSDNTTLRWIVKAVMPAWKRLLGNEDTRDRAAALLHELVKFSEELDNGTD